MRIISALLFAVLIIPCASLAQQDHERDRPPHDDRQYQPPDLDCSVELANAETQQITITYSTDGTHWDNRTIPARTTECWRYHRLQVKVRTERDDKSVKEFSYTLLKDKRYQLYWNTGEKAWDIVELTAR